MQPRRICGSSILQSINLPAELDGPKNMLPINPLLLFRDWTRQASNSQARGLRHLEPPQTLGLGSSESRHLKR